MDDVVLINLLGTLRREAAASVTLSIESNDFPEARFHAGEGYGLLRAVELIERAIRQPVLDEMVKEH